MPYIDKHTWQVGEVITQGKMNNIEDNIQALVNEVTGARTYSGQSSNTLGARIDDLVIVSDTTPTEPNNEIWLDTSNTEGSGTRTVEVPSMEDLHNLESSIADASVYTEGNSYAVGDYVYYNELLYQCNIAITNAGTWDSSKWDNVNLSDVIVQISQEGANEVLIQSAQPIEENNKIWIPSTAGDEIEVPTADEFNKLKSAFDDVTEPTRNKWIYGDIDVPSDGFINVPLETPIQPGAYTLSADTTTTAGTSTTMGVQFFKNNGWGTSDRMFTLQLDQGEHVFASINTANLFNTACTGVRFLSASGVSQSSGYTASYANIQFETGTEATEYVPPYNAVDTVVRAQVQSLFDEVTATTDNLFDDAYALKHAPGVTLENGAFVGSVITFGDFVLLPHGSFETGETYTISFDAMESGTGSTNRLGIFLRTESENNVSYDILNADNSTWHHYSFTYTFADTVYYVRFGRTNTSTNTWYIKNIVINAGSTEIPYVQHLTAYDLVARRANEAISKYSLAYDLYPTGDTTKRNAEMLTILTEKGLCRLAPGEYYVNYLYMPQGTTLIGAGIGKTKIIKDGSGSSYTVRLREECEISNMTLSGYPNDIVAPETLGSGRIGIRIQGTGNDNAQRFHCTIHDMEIINCDYAGVSIYGTGYSPESGCHLYNLYIRQCGYGVFFSSYAEYHIVNNLNATFCTCGVGNYGGNNIFTGFNLCQNKIGVLMDNSSGNYPNNSHGTFTGGAINHNSEYAIKMMNTLAGEVFSSINIFDNGIYIDDCTAVHFNALNCGTSAPIVLNGSQPVFFSNCIFKSGESPISGDNTPIIVNCYTRGGAVWGT